MPVDRIAREIEIDAPIGVVWEIVTTPAHITRWFADASDLEVRAGASGKLRWDDKTTGRPTTVNVLVETVDAPHLFAFRWDFPNGAIPDEMNAPLVELILEERGSGTRVTIVESGLGGVSRSDEEKAAYATDHLTGWVQIAERLRGYAAAHANLSAPERRLLQTHERRNSA
jgi:uncharacterized protein YndB with AHSA1/START domain